MQEAGAVSPDSIRRALDSIFADPVYVWDRPRDPWAWLRNAFLAVQRWFAALHEENVVLYWIIVVALILVLGAILAHAALLVYRAVRDRPVVRARAAQATVVPRDAEWYTRTAARLEAEGRLLESLAARFAALVHRLEERGAVRVHPSRTPMEYAREAALDGPGRSAFTELVRDYYGYLFGSAPVDRAALATFDERAALLTDRAATA